VQFVGFPAALVFGWLGERIGPKRSIYIGLVVYSGVTLGATFMDSVREFYLMAVVIGLVQGGVQSLSRSYYAQIIPADKAGEFFGFYNMLGKFAAVLGPVLMGAVTVATGNQRFGILSILLLFLVGGTLLYFVDEPKRAAA
jgi:UMF1 family MFS transporter